VSRDTQHDLTTLSDPRDLAAWIEAGCKPREARGVGTEHEKFGVWRDSLAPVTYEGERGIGRIFELLAEQPHWEPSFDQDRILALVCHTGAALTLEPGGQLELSGAVQQSIHGTARELEAHFDELRPISEELGIAWLGAGCHPLADVADIPWMPKTRYGLMAPFLGARGGLAHHMMKATSTIQANFDYTSEADARAQLSLCTRLSPVVSAIFANSPLLGRRDTGYDAFRCHVWTDVDPARTGVPPFFLDGTMSFERYVDYVIDIPVMFCRRDGRWLDMGGRTFRQFMERGCEGHAPAMGDWELHLSSVFPDVRLKRFFEVRMADAGDRRAVSEVPALWKGVLYDDTARDAAEALVDGMTLAEQRALAADVARRSLRASWRGQDVLSLARRLVEVATAGLARQAIEGDESEAPFLERVGARLERATTPADLMRTTWNASGHDPGALVELLAM
jgi:glutamate--cysteine ligase